MHNAVNDFFAHNARRGIGEFQIPSDNSRMELRIDELLEESGKSQTDVAHALGVKPSTVSKWASGKNSPPTKKLDELAAYFDVEPLLLFKKYSKNSAAINIFFKLLDLDSRSIRAIETLAETLSDGPAH